MKMLLAILSAPIALCATVQFEDFQWAQGKLTRHEVEEKLRLYLQKDASIGSFFTIKENEFVLYDAPETHPHRSVDFSLKFAQVPSPKPPLLKRDCLNGIKIALDPGHLGGPYAHLEDRYIEIAPSIQREVTARFDEGTLTFLTAFHLKTLLEAEGATVFITRDAVGEEVYKEGFFDWLKHSPDLWSRSDSLKGLFKHFYNLLDLRARAEKINAFSPDLTVVLHYNAMGKDSNHCVSSRNYNVGFIPGGFCHGELNKRQNRYEFIRLLVTEDLQKSVHLSRFILHAFTDHLGVPTVKPEDGATYLDKCGLKIDEGLYCRNLLLTRLIHSPVFYGETLIQNNVDECLNLCRKDCKINDELCSSRIRQVAEAYFKGIRNYLIE